MNQFILDFTFWVTCIVEIIAIIIILKSILLNAKFFLFVFKKSYINKNTESVKNNIGNQISLALELFLAADILETAISPTWNDIGILAAIAALRTILNYFLDKDLKHTSKESSL